MTFQITIDLRAVLVGVVLLLVATAIAAPFAISLADDGDEHAVAQQARAILGTSFTYQGQVNDGSGPATGSYDFEFRLVDDLNGVTQTAGTAPLSRPATPVTNGLFTVQLDFGLAAFDGTARWLEVKAKVTGGAAAPTVLLPRQPFTATPYALHAFSGGTPYTAVPNGGLTLVGTGFGADTTYLQRRVTPGCAASFAIRTVNEDGSVVCESIDNGSSGPGWELAGNAGTTAANFVGTTDNVPLEFRVNGLRGLKIAPATTPNIVGGHPLNEFNAGLVGITIGGGGGQSGDCVIVNRVRDNFGTVSGGCDNYAGSIGTGTAKFATIGGGKTNRANAAYSTVGGGILNVASGLYATVPGGAGNVAQGELSFAAGTNAKATHTGSFVWADDQVFPFNSAGDNTFNVRASGGSFFSGGIFGLTVDGIQYGLAAVPKSGITDDFNGVSARGSGRGPGSAGIFAQNLNTGSASTKCVLPAPSINEYCIGVWGEAFGSASVGVYGKGGQIGVYGDKSPTSNWAGYFNGDVVFTPGYNIYCSNCNPPVSDARAKTNIQDLVPGLAEIMLLHPVSFSFLPEFVDDGGKVHQGLIAQEVRELLPENVYESANGMLGINYPELIPVLIKAIQEQDAKIEALALTTNASPDRAGEGSTVGAAQGHASTPAVIRQDAGPSNAALFTVAGAVTLFALGLFAVTGASLRRRV
jgi:hypothetical protein